MENAKLVMRVENLSRKVDYLITKVEELEKGKPVELKAEKIKDEKINQPASEPDSWVNKETAMRLLGCRTTKLRELKRDGYIDAEFVKGRNRYSVSSIKNYLKDRK